MSRLISEILLFGMLAFFGTAQAATTASTAASSTAPPATPLMMYADFGICSWIEPLTLTSPSGAASPLLAASTGFSLEAGVERVMSRYFHWGIAGGLVFASTEVTNDSSQTNLTTPITPYDLHKAGSFGMRAEPYLLWKPADQAIALGFGLDLMFRHGTWSPPSAGYTISSGDQMLWGPSLLTRYAFLKRYFILSQIGLLGGTTGLAWSLTIGTRL